MTTFLAVCSARSEASRLKTSWLPWLTTHGGELRKVLMPMTQSDKGVKHDDGKLRYDVILPEALVRALLDARGGMLAEAD